MSSVTSPGGLHPKVVRQLVRLKATLPDDFAPREMTVDTPIGKHPVPAPLQALLSVAWPGEGALLINEFESKIELYGAGGLGEVEAGLLPEDRAWALLAVTESQFYWVVDLADERTEDPMVHSVDHDGSERRVPDGVPLSRRLARLELIPPSEDTFARACATGDLDAVTDALRSGIDLGPLDDCGLTPLHLAVISRSVDVVQALLDAGADPTAMLTRQFDARRYLVNLGQFSLGGDMFQGETPLHTVLSGYPRLALTPDVVPAVTQALLAAGADPGAVYGHGWTPLRHAVGSGLGPDDNADVVRLLLAAGADPNPVTDADSTTLIEAVLSYESVLALLLDAGADPCLRTDYTIYDVDGVTALHCAVAWACSEAKLRMLLAKSTNPDVRTARGVTPLHFAVKKAFPAVDHRFNLLLDAGADPNARLEDPTALQEGLRSHTPLAIARELGKDEVAAFLERAGATA